MSKLSKLVNVSRSYSRNKSGTFYGPRCTNRRQHASRYQHALRTVRQLGAELAPRRRRPPAMHRAAMPCPETKTISRYFWIIIRTEITHSIAHASARNCTLEITDAIFARSILIYPGLRRVRTWRLHKAASWVKKVG